MTSNNEQTLQEEQTLKHLLEFLARLDESESIKQKVIEEIEQKVKDYVKDGGKKFGNNGYLFETIKKCQKLRKNILKSGQETQYKHYNTQFQDSAAHKYTEHLINNIFALFGCLYYMYYECSDDCIKIYGNEWHDERCDGRGRYQYLNHWLKDEKPSTEDSEDATDTPEDGTKHMIKRGFKQDELSTKKGEYLFPNEEHEKDRSNRLLNYEYGAQLQFALYYMLFLPGKWNDAQSGHAVLFLEAFCEKVSENKFNGQYTATDDGQGFKSACQNVQQSINTLTGLNIIAPVAADNTAVKYNDLLQPEYFSKYIEWLKKNLKNLIDSLTEMANDASNWDAFKLISSETYGPYPWGFTFKDQNWEQKKEQLQQQLEQQVSQLTKALRTLKDALPSASKANSVSEKAAETSSSSTASNISAEKPSASTVSTNSTEEPSGSTDSTDSTDSNDSTNSTASTLGGVAGGIGAAAATAGAAYAGSGFLGPVAEAIGKFFKGLFL